MNKLVDTIIRYSDVDPNCTYGSQHFSGIFKNGKLCHLGSNHMRNSYNNECVCFSTHAEMDVIHKVLKEQFIRSFKTVANLNDYTVVVVRIGRDGTIKNSRPCKNCLDMMTKYKIKKIIYSTDTSFESHKPRDMNSYHVSSGWTAYRKLSK